MLDDIQLKESTWPSKRSTSHQNWQRVNQPSVLEKESTSHLCKKGSQPAIYARKGVNQPSMLERESTSQYSLKEVNQPFMPQGSDDIFCRFNI